MRAAVHHIRQALNQTWGIPALYRVPVCQTGAFRIWTFNTCWRLHVSCQLRSWCGSRKGGTAYTMICQPHWRDCSGCAWASWSWCRPWAHTCTQHVQRIARMQAHHLYSSLKFSRLSKQQKAHTIIVSHWSSGQCFTIMCALFLVLDLHKCPLVCLVWLPALPFY